MLKTWTKSQKSNKLPKLSQDETAIPSNPAVTEFVIHNFQKGNIHNDFASLENSPFERRANINFTQSQLEDTVEGAFPKSFYKTIKTQLHKLDKFRKLQTTVLHQLTVSFLKRINK